MNVNDVICVGAEPLAVLDYIAVEDADPDMLRAVAEGLKRGAEDAGVEIPGGELAQLPELIRGHPSPRGFDLVGACFGTIALDSIVTGASIEPGDAIVGLPASGVHSNGLTLARRALPDLDERPDELRAADVEVRGLAHITSGGLLNLLRLEAEVGYSIDSPLPRLPVFELIAVRSGAAEAELQEVFNMGCGFCVVVPAEQADRAIEIAAARHPGAARIGAATADAGVVELPSLGLSGREGAGFAPA
jgi:phosphoribosylformylglycinamidine cyclo-ligase